MPSRRRTANKNLSNNLAEVQRRLRTLERRPTRSKLGNRSVTGAAIGPNSVDSTQVSFGINLVTSVDQVTGAVIPPTNILDGTTRTDPNTGLTETWSESLQAWIKTTDPMAQFAADTAAADAAQAAADAAQAASDASDAMTSANGKNTVFRQSITPTAKAVGDIWFDSTPDASDLTSSGTAAGGSRPKRWTGSAWVPFGLSYAAITSLDADKIVAGTITGRTLKTSGTGRRIEITDSDDIIFYGHDPTTSLDYQVGLITPIAAGWSDTSTDSGGSYNIAGGVAIIGSTSAVLNGAASFPNITVASDTDLGTVGAYLFGSAGTYLSIDSAGVASYGDENSGFQIWNDQISFNASYSVDPGVGRYINFWGPIAFQDLNNGDGPLLQGSGIPSADGKYTGQIIFRYT